jgi:hypothetical protein
LHRGSPFLRISRKIPAEKEKRNMSVQAATNAIHGALSGLSQAQSDMLASAPAEMKPFLEAQMKMQKEQELVQFIAQAMKGDHEDAQNILRNIGG